MERRRGDKYLTLWTMGGLLYIALELLWRWQSHWSMFVLEACLVTALEFLTGYVVNLWLGWGVWDYSGMPGNVLGQICPQYCWLWMSVSLAGIVLDEILRCRWWNNERPHYNIGFTRGRARIIWLPAGN